MSINCDVIMFFTIFGQFGAIQKPNSGHRVCKFTFSITITGTRYDMKFYASVAKGLKLGVKMFWRLIPTFVEVTEEKLVGELPPPPSPTRQVVYHVFHSTYYVQFYLLQIVPVVKYFKVPKYYEQYSS